MKNISTIVLLILLQSLVTKTSNSQFLPADWRQGIYFNGNVFNSPPPHPLPIRFVGDTIICGINYSIICRLSNWGSGGMNCVSYTYVRKQAGQIYTGGNCGYPDELLYDFSLNVNDTITLQQTVCHRGNFIVDSIYNIMLLNGTTRKYMVLHGTDMFNQSDTLKWIEDIGDINNGFFPECDFEGGHSNFICHKENGQTLWINSQNSSLADCDSITSFPTTGINNLAYEQNKITISPNPMNNKLNITVSNNNLYEIILYEITSRKTMQQKFTNSVSLNTEQLAKGIYLYEMRNLSGGLWKKGKIVKD